MNIFRRDDEEESKLDFLVQSQQELQGIVEPLQANLERSLAESANLTQTAQKEDVKAQMDWLAEALRGMHQNFLDEMRAQKEELLADLQKTRAENGRQIAELRGEFGPQFQALRAQNAALQNEFKQHREEWQEATDFELRDETPAALDEWQMQIRNEIKPFGACTGAVRLLAGRLMQQLQALCVLRGQIESGQGGFESRLDELGVTLFSPERGASWSSLTPLNSTPEQRRTLRLLEMALWQFRAAVQEILRRKTGIAPLEIVPGETRFDARFHESSEFLEVATDDATRHNLILSIERPGYEKTAPDGAKTLLQIARVQREVLQAPSNLALSNLAPPETAPAPPISSPTATETSAPGSEALSSEPPQETAPAFPTEKSNDEIKELDKLITPRPISPAAEGAEIGVLEAENSDSKNDAENVSVTSEDRISGQL